MLIYKIKSLSPILLNKKVNILTSPKITKKINKSNYLNTDILKLNKENIIAFSNYDYLKVLKTYMNHPYEISSLKINDFIYYLEESNNNLLIIDDVICYINKNITHNINIACTKIIIQDKYK